MKEFAAQTESYGNAAHMENAGAFSTIAWKSPKPLFHIPTASAAVYKFIKEKKGEKPKIFDYQFPP
jgi:hypothetical protein